ncbi:MAG TPA: aromatic/alkene monooxygenase hydroxylase subunit beta [Ilumatobacteraceae bacterium]|nr:aromatic/alkene monooxygenase hydroxylase subunit beta [Ilumatobacteraceae bacterium]
MQIDLRTVNIKPIRQTFTHVAARIGQDKPASRYQEAVLDVQANANFHYRPTWDPDHEIFDPTRSKLVMADWYAFRDPRQMYYATYCNARSRMQETAEADFEFVERRGLAETFAAGAKQKALQVLVPLRHVAWGANMNNSAICAYGYGTTLTAPCIFQAMDQLGIAQYLSRVGLLLGDVEALEAGKRDWMEGAEWQELRRYVEDTLVLSDPIEQYVAQNVVLDGLLFPLIYDKFDTALTAEAGPTISMLLRFQSEWFAETSKWVDSTLKTAAGESAANTELLNGWVSSWRDRAVKALAPVADLALGGDAAAALTDVVNTFNARAAKSGLSV